ncbi:MAG: hypothetical protein ABIY37_00775, partial [Devosia sp.]
IKLSFYLGVSLVTSYAAPHCRAQDMFAPLFVTRCRRYAAREMSWVHLSPQNDVKRKGQCLRKN